MVVIESRTPLGLSVVEEINVPRHLSLTRISIAMQAKVRASNSRDLDIDRSRTPGLSDTRHRSIPSNDEAERGEVIGRTPDTASKLLIQKLRELGVL